MARPVVDETLDLSYPVPATRVSPNGRSRRRGRLVEVSAPAVPAWEWAIVVVALFLLARSPVYFYRLRIAELTGGRVFYSWQDDGVIRAVTAGLLLTVYVLAARRCDPRTLLRQPLLLAVLAMALASAAWSVEPTVTLWRSAFFLGTAVLGWYMAERFSLREQIGIVGAMAALSAAASGVALVAWPDVSHRTGRLENAWSGAYANRNWLALVMSIGLLTIPFVWATLPRRRRVLLLLVAGGEAFLLFRTGSRTGPVALATALAVAIALLVVRKLDLRPLGPIAGAATVGLITGYVGLVVRWNWTAIERWLGRKPGWSGRARLWQTDLVLASDKPWTGWGFESVWAHPATVARATESLGRFPYAAHSGYYEILLSVGLVGLLLFLLFLGVAGWRAFRFAFADRNGLSMWPIVFIVFAVVANFTESLFISAEAIWALTVAAAVSPTPAVRRRRALS